VDPIVRTPLREAGREGLQPGEERIRRHHQSRRRPALEAGPEGGGGVARLKTVREQMQKAFGL
jgi:hypothetical protein